MGLRRLDLGQALGQVMVRLDQKNHQPCRNMPERLSKKCAQLGLNVSALAIGVSSVARDVIVLVGVILLTPVKMAILFIRVIRPHAFQHLSQRLDRLPSCLDQIAKIIVDTLSIGASSAGVALFVYKGSEWNVAMQKSLSDSVKKAFQERALKPAQDGAKFQAPLPVHVVKAPQTVHKAVLPIIVKPPANLPVIPQPVAFVPPSTLPKLNTVAPQPAPQQQRGAVPTVARVIATVAPNVLPNVNAVAPQPAPQQQLGVPAVAQVIATVAPNVLPNVNAVAPQPAPQQQLGVPAAAQVIATVAPGVLPNVNAVAPQPAPQQQLGVPAVAQVIATVAPGVLPNVNAVAPQPAPQQQLGVPAERKS